MRARGQLESACSLLPARRRAAASSPETTLRLRESASSRTSLSGVVGSLVVRRSLTRRGFTCSGRCTSTSGFDHANGAVGIDKGRTRHAANVGLGDLIDAIDGAEQLAPVAVACLVGGELR